MTSFLYCRDDDDYTFCSSWVENFPFSLAVLLCLQLAVYLLSKRGKVGAWLLPNIDPNFSTLSATTLLMSCLFGHPNCKVTFIPPPPYSWLFLLFLSLSLSGVRLTVQSGYDRVQKGAHDPDHLFFHSVLSSSFRRATYYFLSICLEEPFHLADSVLCSVRMSTLFPVTNQVIVGM